MRLPDRPPKLTKEDLEQAINSLFKPAVQEYVSAANTEYHHWEELQYRKAPEGLTPAQAWQIVKLLRAGQRRFIPLVDDKGRAFSYWLPNPAQEILHEVDRGGGSMLALPEGSQAALGAMRDRVLVSSLMEEAIATSQIEGAATTRKVAKEMLRTNRKPRDRSEQMIVNSYRTIQLLRERLDEPLSLDLLFDIQKSMTRDTLDDATAAGRFRTVDEQISVVDVRDGEVMFTPPPAGDLPERMGKLIAFANAPAEKENFIHPLVKAAILHFWLAYEHPYVDGNGRTARALLYWFMLKSGYWLFEFLTISRAIAAAPMRYYRSLLYSEHDDNDLTYSVLFQLRATQRALGALRTYLAQKQAEQQAMAAVLRQLPAINYRQRALLEDALRDPSQVHTFKSHSITHNISLLTARADLIGLAERGMMTEIKQGRQRGFVAAADLVERLSAGSPRPKRRRR